MQFMVVSKLRLPASLAVLLSATASACGESESGYGDEQNMSNEAIVGEVIAMERATLDEWGRGHTTSCADVASLDVTYFDPSLERRLEGRSALRELYSTLEGEIRIDRYDMVEPKVQVYDGVAILTYNLLDYLTDAVGVEDSSRWNVTQVYYRHEGQWQVVSSHFSRTRCEP